MPSTIRQIFGSEGIKSIAGQLKSYIMCQSAKSEWHLSNSFHASPSVGCLNFPSSVHSSLCHLNELAVFEHINNRWSLGIKGKCLKTFNGTLWFLIFFNLIISFYIFIPPWSAVNMARSIVLVIFPIDHVIIRASINFLIIQP
jgi:hypothetical protein